MAKRVRLEDSTKIEALSSTATKVAEETGKRLSSFLVPPPLLRKEDPIHHTSVQLLVVKLFLFVVFGWLPK